MTIARCPAPSQPPTRWAWAGAMALLLALTGCSSLPTNVERPPSSAWATPEATGLGQLARSLQPASRSGGAESGFALLTSADMALQARLALVDAAEKTLDIQYYAIHADPTTALLFTRLRAAAARGVRVRILLDDFNSTGRDAQVLRLAFVPNIALRLFNPLPGGRGSLMLRILGSLDDVPRIQRRMHNKIFVADNAWAITGGRNLGETYFGQGDATQFIDTDLLATGPVVRALSTSFDSYWNNELAYPMQSLVSRDELDALRAQQTASAAPPSDTVGSAPPATARPPRPELPVVAPLDVREIPLTWAPAAVLVDKPSKIAADAAETEDRQDTVVDGLLQLVAQARRELLIVSPYFVPGERMMAQFIALRARGVRIRILTNSLASNDAPLAHVGYARYRTALLEAGIELFEMRAAAGGTPGGISGSGSTPGSRASLHSKLVVMDGRLLVVGSMNLDLRSQLQNSEVALVVRSPALARSAAQLIETTLAGATYRVQQVNGQLVWSAAGPPPPGTDPPAGPLTTEPDTGVGLRLLLWLIGPLAPDEML